MNDILGNIYTVPEILYLAYFGIGMMLLMIPVELVIQLFDPYWQYSRMPSFAKYTKEYDSNIVIVKDIMSQDYSKLKHVNVKKWTDKNTITVRMKFLSRYPVEVGMGTFISGLFIFEESPGIVKVTFKPLVSVSMLGMILGLYLILLGIFELVLVDYGMGVPGRLFTESIIALLLIVLVRQTTITGGNLPPLESNFNYMINVLCIDKRKLHTSCHKNNT